MQNYLLYQALQSTDLVNECRYSLLKYLSVYNLKPPANTSVVIYTDQPAMFEEFESFFHGFEMQPVDAEEKKMWRGTQNSTERLKIHVLRDFFETYTGNVLYCDTNTYALAPIDGIFQNISSGIVHLHEEKHPEKWQHIFRDKSIDINGEKVQLNVTMKFFDTAIIGVNSNVKPLLNNIVALNDSIYNQFTQNNTEDFAFSYYLQLLHTIKTSNHVIAHYYNLNEFQELLRVFFKKNEEESIPNQIKLVQNIDALEIQRNKIHYNKLPLYKKLLNAITGKQWSIKEYQNKI
ncbi:MAG: hypothetical protein ABR502_08945 [Chitinophagaceae bacterium]